MNRRKESRLIRLLFLAAVVLFLILGLGKAFLFPADISQYELRYNNKVPQLSVSGFLDGSFQTGMDDALADQILFSSYCKMLYNELVSRLDGIFLPVRGSVENRYVAYHGLHLFNGQLVHLMSPVEESKDAIDVFLREVDPIIEEMPETQFYLYYVVNDTDIDFVSGESSGTFDYLCDKLSVPRENCAALPITSFEDFRENFFYSDHHWNNKGSYKAYLQLLELTGAEGAPLLPLGERELPGIFYGSKGRSVGSTTYLDRISVYDFDFPPMEYSLSGSPLPDYGDTDASAEVISYGTVYGDDLGCLVISTGASDRENILLLGESYDNAILKLLASHFNNTHSIDLRYYSYQTGEAFSLSDYVRQNNISKVLFIGSSGFFSQDLWMMEG